MDINSFIKSIIKKPIQRGNNVYVYDGNGELLESYPTIYLGKMYFSMSNDAFYDTFGFNFVPEGRYYEKSKRAAGKM